MLDSFVVAALVALISALLKQFAPGFPVSDELITAIVVVLLGLFGLEVVKAVFPSQTSKLRERGLLK